MARTASTNESSPATGGPEQNDISDPATTRIRGLATVFSDFASQLGARLGSAVLSLVAVMITTRILTPAEYGEIAYFFVVATLIFTITSAWTSTAVSRYAREELETQGRMTAVTWGRLLIVAPLVAVAAAAVLLLKFSGALPPELTWPFVFLAVTYGVVWIALDHVVYLLEAAGRMKMSAVSLASQQALYVAGLVAIYVSGLGQTAFIVASLSLVSMALVTVASTALVWRVAIWPPRLNRPLLKRIVKLSLPLIAFTVSQYVLRSVDIVVLRALDGVAAAGVYAVAYQGYSVLAAVATAAPPLLTPLFVSLRAASRDALIERYLKRVVPQLSFVASVICGVLAPLATALMPLVFGARFADAAQPMAILLVPVLLLFTANLVAPILVLHERGGAIAVLNGAAAAVNLLGDLLTVGVLHMGPVGPAISTSAALLVIAIGFYGIAVRCVGVDAILNPLLLLPVVAGLLPALLLPPALGVVTAILATLLCAVIVLRAARPFVRDDLQIVSALDMPQPLKRLAVWGVTLASR
jgi:O-antigen/teichoic acid export membrane protein